MDPLFKFYIIVSNEHKWPGDVSIETRCLIQQSAHKCSCRWIYWECLNTKRGSQLLLPTKRCVLFIPLQDQENFVI
jgi:hypothetical protein